MKYLSLFSGIGGFELGIQQAHEDLRDNGEQKSDVKGLQSERDKPNSKRGLRNEWQQNPHCIGYSEIDKYAIQIYEKYYPNHKNYGDITKINAEDLPEFDLVVGGFPCQSFSIAGKRGGFSDTRGTLFFDIARIAKAKQPMFMLLENVKGLISHDGGKTLEVILETLQELGYYVNYEIRNSKDYGVPQNRERIFFLCKHIKLLSSVGQSEKMTTSEEIIEEWLFQILLNNLKEAQKLQGTESKDWVLGYLLWKEIYQNPSLNEGNILDGISTDMGGKSSLFKGDPWQNIDIWLSNNLAGDLQELNMSTISTAIKGIIESKTYTFLQMFKATLLATVLLRKSSNLLWNEILSNLILIQEDTKHARINNKNEKTIITESGTAHLSSELQDPKEYFSLQCLRGTPRPQVFPFGTSSERNDSPAESGKQLLGTRQYTGAIDANYHKGADGKRTLIAKTVRSGGRSSPHGAKQNWDSYLVDAKIRRLTPTECERLQGFPDGWTEGVSDTQRYKTLGNAVTVNVIREIINKLL